VTNGRRSRQESTRPHQPSGSQQPAASQEPAIRRKPPSQRRTPARPTRLITPDDAPALAEQLRVNRAFLAPWEPIRGEEYYSVEGQRKAVEAALDEHRQGRCLPHVILGEAGQVVGRITLSGIVRGAFQSASVGYWVAEAYNGRGLATAALRHIVRLAFDDLRLHRVQAEVQPHNVASQRVLERNGFTRIGFAPRYLAIAGEWRDHIPYRALHPRRGGPLL